MRADVLRDLLAKLDLCQADAAAVHEFRRMIEAVGSAHGIAMAGPADRITFVRRLLRSGSPRPEIRDRLMARFNVGRSQAYADIGEALQIVQSAT